MNSYNTKQKIIVAAFLLIFALSFIIAAAIILSDSEVNSITKNFKEPIAKLEVYKNSELVTTTEYSDDSQVAVVEDSIITLSNKAIIYSTSKSTVTVNESTINVIDGIIYLEALEPFTVNFNNQSFQLSQDFSGFFNSEEKSIQITEGQLVFDQKTVGKNNRLIWQVDNYEVGEFKRSKLIELSYVVEIIEFTQSINKLPAILSDFSPPAIINISPEDSSEFEVAELVLTAETEPTAKAFINNKETPVNFDGSFDAVVILEEGFNTIEIFVVDEFGNESVKLVNYNYIPALNNSTQDTNPL